MSIIIDEALVRQFLPMDEAIERIEAAFVQHGRGQVTNVPRARLRAASSVLMVMSASMPEIGYMGFKAYSVAKGGARFHTWLYSIESGELVAIIAANLMGQIRTGAASGVATRAFTAPSASVLGLIGTGRQAAMQLEAVANVCPLELVRVFSRTQERRERFADEMSERYRLKVVAVGSSAEAVEGADVVSAITNSREPVFDGELLRDGAHVNAAGNNQARNREVDAATIRRASRITVDALDNAQLECGELIAAVDAGDVAWDSVGELGKALADERTGPVVEGISLFESQGVAFEDVAVGGLVYEAVRAAGLGWEVDL